MHRKQKKSRRKENFGNDPSLSAADKRSELYTIKNENMIVDSIEAAFPELKRKAFESAIWDTSEKPLSRKNEEINKADSFGKSLSRFPRDFQELNEDTNSVNIDMHKSKKKKKKKENNMRKKNLRNDNNSDLLQNSKEKMLTSPEVSSLVDSFSPTPTTTGKVDNLKFMKKHGQKKFREYFEKHLALMSPVTSTSTIISILPSSFTTDSIYNETSTNTLETEKKITESDLQGKETFTTKPNVDKVKQETSTIKEETENLNSKQKKNKNSKRRKKYRKVTKTALNVTEKNLGSTIEENKFTNESLLGKMENKTFNTTEDSEVSRLSTYHSNLNWESNSIYVQETTKWISKEKDDFITETVTTKKNEVSNDNFLNLARNEVFSTTEESAKQLLNENIPDLSINDLSATWTNSSTNTETTKSISKIENISAIEKDNTEMNIREENTTKTKENSRIIKLKEKNNDNPRNTEIRNRLMEILNNSVEKNMDIEEINKMLNIDLSNLTKNKIFNTTEGNEIELLMKAIPDLSQHDYNAIWNSISSNTKLRKSTIEKETTDSNFLKSSKTVGHTEKEFHNNLVTFSNEDTTKYSPIEVEYISNMINPEVPSNKEWGEATVRKESTEEEDQNPNLSREAVSNGFKRVSTESSDNREHIYRYKAKKISEYLEGNVTPSMSPSTTSLQMIHMTNKPIKNENELFESNLKDQKINLNLLSQSRLTNEIPQNTSVPTDLIFKKNVDKCTFTCAAYWKKKYELEKKSQITNNKKIKEEIDSGLVNSEETPVLNSNEENCTDSTSDLQILTEIFDLQLKKGDTRNTNVKTTKTTESTNLVEFITESSRGSFRSTRKRSKNDKKNNKELNRKKKTKNQRKNKSTKKSTTIEQQETTSGFTQGIQRSNTWSYTNSENTLFETKSTAPIVSYTNSENTLFETKSTTPIVSYTSSENILFETKSTASTSKERIKEFLSKETVDITERQPKQVIISSTTEETTVSKDLPTTKDQPSRKKCINSKRPTTSSFWSFGFGNSLDSMDDCEEDTTETGSTTSDLGGTSEGTSTNFDENFIRIKEFSTTEEYVCDEDQFLCDKNNCIAEVKVCDGVKNCMDASDEDDCDYYYDKVRQHRQRNITDNNNTRRFPSVCGKYEFSCDERCLNNIHACDGVINCKDGSDEADCGYEGTEKSIGPNIGLHFCYTNLLLLRGTCRLQSRVFYRIKATNWGYLDLDLFLKMLITAVQSSSFDVTGSGQRNTISLLEVLPCDVHLCCINALKERL